MNNKELKLDKSKAVRMINLIYQLELENAKTQKYDEKRMLEEIEKIIEVIVKGDV